MGDGVVWGGSEASAAVPAGSDAAPKQLTRGELMEKAVQESKLQAVALAAGTGSHLSMEETAPAALGLATTVVDTLKSPDVTQSGEALVKAVVEAPAVVVPSAAATASGADAGCCCCSSSRCCIESTIKEGFSFC